MIRVFALLSFLVLAAALAFGPSLMAPAVAQGSGSGVKVCKAKTSTGKIKKWRCGKDQACCHNPFLDTYSCGIPGLGCL